MRTVRVQAKDAIAVEQELKENAYFMSADIHTFYTKRNDTERNWTPEHDTIYTKRNVIIVYTFRIYCYDSLYTIIINLFLS